MKLDTGYFVRHWAGSALLVALTVLGTAQGSHPSRNQISLDGEWGFRLDPLDEGEGQLRPPTNVEGRIQVPGNWQAQGYGQPDGTLAHDYQGAAWYRKEVDVPADWEGRVVELAFEGSLVHTTAFVNGKEAGDVFGISAPFRFDVSELIEPGARNVVTVRVSNTEPPGTHEPGARRAIPGITGCLNYEGRWGGLHQSVSLEARNPVSVRHMGISTSLAESTSKLTLHIDNRRSHALTEGRVEVAIYRRSDGAVVGRDRKTFAAAAMESAEVAVTVAVADMMPWSPEQPNLYEARLEVLDGDRRVDEVRETFGFREISVSGNQILLNGSPVYLRGYGDDSIYVMDGTPPTEKQEWVRRLRIAKSLGFNAVRFHSMTPPRVGFEAADEVGILVAAELPVVTVEHFLPYRDLLREELIRTIHTFRNHPSWVFFAMGNEFSTRRVGGGEQARLMQDTSQALVDLAESLDQDRIYMANQGYMVEPADIAVLYQGVALDRPTIKHEYGAYHTSLPDFSLIDRMTGAIRPTWLEEQRETIMAFGVEDRYHDYLQSSWRLLQISRKAFLEKLRSREDIQGYYYWLITDFPGGTPEGPAWRWGWLNYFWEPKGFTLEEAQELNSPVIPLIDRDLNERTLWADEKTSIGVSVSNDSSAPLQRATLEWSLSADGAELISGEETIPEAPEARVTPLGQIEWGALDLDVPTKLALSVTVRSDTGDSHNHWDFWAFPRPTGVGAVDHPVVSLLPERDVQRYFPFVEAVDVIPSVQATVVAPTLSADVVSHLEQGGNAIVLGAPGAFGEADVYLPTGLGGARGLVMEPHPALGDFPHDGFPDLQMHALLEGASAFPLDSAWREYVPAQGVSPIVGGLVMTRDRARGQNVVSPVAYLLELKVGPGKLLISTLNFRGRLDDAYPGAVYALGQLLEYVTSDQFNPTHRISLGDAQILAVPYTEMIH